ncbi:hypothetical protein [Streptomyces phaeochromogenes]|uniref:hypothetical protein n=1 Tax=Streptomyces phaeochromogenes TaxID=1923 RepID=UPI002E0F9EE4|nr:hypothetical protein OG437_40975 [Streptomyces phaeochromogenes]
MNAMNSRANTVSVDEVHTEVSTAGTGDARPPGVVPGAAEAGWNEIRGRLDWIEARTRAEGFDD